jgi:hypothetical protein
MARTVVVDIPEKTYARLEKLSRFFGQDVDKSLLDLLESLSESDQWLESLGEKFKPAPVALSNFLTNMTTSAVMHIKKMDPIPEMFHVQGSFWITLFEADVDKGRFEFSYNTLPGCKLTVTRFDLNYSPEVINLYIMSMLEAEKTTPEALDKLKVALQSLKPKIFKNLERFTVETEEREGLFTIDLNCYAHSIRHFPSVLQISALLKRVFTTCGIEEKAWID